MPEVKTPVGGSDGYTIYKVETKDDNGDIIGTRFFLYDPKGEFVEAFNTLEEAEAALEDILYEGPRP